MSRRPADIASDPRARALLRTLVALNGTIPNGWMWDFNADAAVARE